MNPLILQILMAALTAAPKIIAEVEKAKTDASASGQDTQQKLTSVLGDIATIAETLATAL